MTEEEPALGAAHSREKGTVIVFSGECATPTSASARRTRCISLALAHAGWDVTIHTTLVRPRRRKDNGFRENGVRFRYSSYWGGALSNDPVAGMFLRILGSARLAVDVATYCTFRRPRLVYLYNSSAMTQVLVSVFYRAGIPVIKEYCEWYPCLPCYTPRQKAFWDHLAFTRLAGVVAISEEIVRRILQRSDRARIGKLPILKVPILYEEPFPETRVAGNGKFLWCGGVDGYMDTILFLVHALSLCVSKYTPPTALQIFGAYSDGSAQQVRHAAHQRLVEDRIVLRGFVGDAELRTEMAESSALLLPLFDDEQSRTRFPTKLAEYLASGSPVIASAMGELGKHLSDRRSALLAEPGNVASFADCMGYAVANPTEAREIGRRGRAVAEANFFYQVHAARLSKYFSEVAG